MIPAELGKVKAPTNQSLSGLSDDRPHPGAGQRAAQTSAVNVASVDVQFGKARLSCGEHALL